jgi:choline kinase
MTGVILAAGRGSRLQSHTEHLPKALLPLAAGMTLLDYNLKLFEKHGITRRLVVTGYRSESIRRHVRSVPGVQCIYNPFWEHCNVLGSLYIALPHINDDFAFAHADTLVAEAAWQRMLSMCGDIVLPYDRKKCGEEEMKVLHDADGRLRQISKQIPPETADGEFLGVAKFAGGVIPYIAETAEYLFRTAGLQHYMEAVIAEAIGTAIDIQTFEIDGVPFVEVDFIEDYDKAKKIFGGSP